MRKRYDQLWAAAIRKLRAGEVDLDPVLAARVPDARRGLTVIARPSQEVRQRVGAFLRELRALEPEQYYYASSALHLTVLSLFTATVQHEPFFAQTERYISAVTSALRTVAPFKIRFEGVTVSPGTVMLEGFVENTVLNEAREALRRQLQAYGLEEGLDGRYRLETVHMTVVRFRAPLRDSEQFVAALRQARGRAFGTSSITHLSLIKSDWYLTRRTLEPIRRYRLSSAG